MNTLIETLKYFVFITAELIALFLLISAVVEIILMYIPQDKIKQWLSGRGILGNVMAAGFGALTPFLRLFHHSDDSRFPQCGVPFGSTMSFLIASPLLNPIIIGMLGAMVGVKAMLAYFIIAFACLGPVRCGIGKNGDAEVCENVRLRNEHNVGSEDKRQWTIKRKLREAFVSAWDSLRPILGYLLIGVALEQGYTAICHKILC